MLTSDEADGIMSSLALVAAGRGVAVLPISLLEVERPGVTMRPFEPPAPVIEMGAVHVAHNDSAPLVVFMNVVRAVAASYARDETRQVAPVPPRRFRLTPAVALASLSRAPASPGRAGRHGSRR
jgi:hypothetical protein